MEGIKSQFLQRIYIEKIDIRRVLKAAKVRFRPIPVVDNCNQ